MDLLQSNQLNIESVSDKKIRALNKKLFFAFILTMPFTSGFAITDTISMPLILAVILFLTMCYHFLFIRNASNDFLGFDIFIVALFLLVVVFSFFINGFESLKSLNHTIAYLSSFLLFYVTIKFHLFEIKNKREAIKKVLYLLTITTLATAIFVNVEFISDNLFGFNLNDYIPRPTAEEMFYQAGVIDLFHRSRGFASESGGMAFMMELFTPLVIYYFYFSDLCTWNKWIKRVLMFFIIMSFLFAASTASFLIIPASFIISSFFFIKKVIRFLKSKLTKVLIFTVLGSMLLVVLNYLFSILFFIILSVSDKFDSVSFDDRKDRIDFFYEQSKHFNIINKIIGTGPAGYQLLGFDDSKSIISLYYNTVFEIGYLGFFLLILLFIYILFQTLRIRDAIGYFLFVSIIAGMMHFYISQCYWTPWFWFVVVFALFYYNYSKRIIQSNSMAS